MTQAPTPGPLSAEDVKLLVKGDLLLCKSWGVVQFDRFDDSGVRAFVLDLKNNQIRLMKPINMAFIGRPSADGWMPWSGGENPVGDAEVEIKCRDGSTDTNVGSWWHWNSEYAPIIAFRLAPTAPVEASGSERESARDELAKLINPEAFVPMEDVIGMRKAYALADKIIALTGYVSTAREGLVYLAADAPVWADGIVTDGERVALAQKAEADYGGTYWATDDGGDGAVEWEPTHFIDMNALLSARRLALGGQQGGDWPADVDREEFLRWVAAGKPARAEAQDEGAEMTRLLKLADSALANVTAFEDDARYIMGNTNYAITENARSEIRSFLLAQSAKTSVRPKALEILERLLDHSGARGSFDAMKHGDAVKDAEELLRSARSPGHTDLMVTPESIDAYMRVNPMDAQNEGAAGKWPEVTDQWAETYCDLTGQNPDGAQVSFIGDGAVTTTFRDKAKRQIEAMLCAAPKAAVRAISPHPSPTPSQDEGAAGEIGAAIDLIEWAISRNDDLRDYKEPLAVVLKAARAHPSPPPAADEDRVRITDADAKWLAHWLGDQKEGGHCGEGNVERRERAIWNDRIDRIIAALKSEGK